MAEKSGRLRYRMPNPEVINRLKVSVGDSHKLQNLKLGADESGDFKLSLKATDISPEIDREDYINRRLAQRGLPSFQELKQRFGPRFHYEEHKYHKYYDDAYNKTLEFSLVIDLTEAEFEDFVSTIIGRVHGIFSSCSFEYRNLPWDGNMDQPLFAIFHARQRFWDQPGPLSVSEARTALLERHPDLAPDIPVKTAIDMDGEIYVIGDTGDGLICTKLDDSEYGISPRDPQPHLSGDQLSLEHDYGPLPSNGSTIYDPLGRRDNRENRAVLDRQSRPSYYRKMQEETSV